MSSTKFSPIRLAAVAALVAGSASAQAQNLITNGSFELGSVLNTGFSLLNINDTTIPGWTVVTDDLAWMHSSFGSGSGFLSADDGNKFLDLTSTTATCLPCGGVQQTIATTPGETYELSFSLGSSSGYLTPSAVMATAVGIGNQTFTSTATGVNNWERVSMTFVATGAATTIRLVGSFAQGDYVGLDNVAVVAAPIPEPGALALMLAGLAAVGSVVSRRKLSA